MIKLLQRGLEECFGGQVSVVMDVVQVPVDTEKVGWGGCQSEVLLSSSQSITNVLLSSE